MLKSSSIHSMNMDSHPTQGQIRFWMRMNRLINGWRPNATPPWLAVENFAPTCSNAEWDRLLRKASPVRKWCDLFWINLPWNEIRKTYGDLSVMDLGCGKGQYASFWEELSGGFTKYQGVDAKAQPSWQDASANPRRTFHASDINSFFQNNTVEANLWFSQSALEHFPHDIHLMSLIREQLVAQGRPSLQVHLVPSSACLGMYRQHGVRQYTPRSAGRLIRDFQKDSICTVFRLGGPSSNQAYMDWILNPLLQSGIDRRDTETDAYEAACRNAAQSDMGSPGGEPSFLAIVIEYLAERSLFRGRWAQ